MSHENNERQRCLCGDTYRENNWFEVLAEELWKMTESFVKKNKNADEHRLMARHQHTITKIIIIIITTMIFIVLSS